MDAHTLRNSDLNPSFRNLEGSTEGGMLSGRLGASRAVRWEGELVGWGELPRGL